MGEWIVKSGHYSAQGQRPYQEDTAVTYDGYFTPEQPTQANGLWEVFDGHSDNREMSKYGCEYMVDNMKGLPSEEVDSRHFLQDHFLKLDSSLYNKFDNTSNNGGSTALLCLLHNRELITANLGDSEAMLLTQEVETKWSYKKLSTVHKPTVDSEYQRIVTTSKSRTYNGELIPSWVAANRVCGSLAVSRAFGDFSLKSGYTTGEHGQNAVSFYPDISYTPLDVKKSYILILASDGFWDVCQNLYLARGIIIAFGEQHNWNPSLMAHSLTEHALLMGSADNVTVVVVNIFSKFV